MKRTLPLGKTRKVRFASDSLQRQREKNKGTMSMKHNLSRTVLGVVSSRLGLIFVLLLALSVVMFLLYGQPGGILFFSRAKHDATGTTYDGDNQNIGHVEKEDKDRIVETEAGEVISEKIDENNKKLKYNKKQESDSSKTDSSSASQTKSTVMKQNVPSDEYHVLLQLVNAEPGKKFALNFYNCIKSILSKTSLNLTIHVTCDPKSRLVAENVFKKVFKETSRHISRRVYYDVDKLNEKLYTITKPLQELFSSGQGAYYSQALFFIPVALHKVLPEEMTKMVMLDTDLQFRTDIKKLFALFDQMSQTNIMALAREQQPVYRHVINMYRSSHPDTKLGGPPPDGYTGFNSGVKLINIKAMRANRLYNNILMNETKIKSLADKYTFKGHLGDQDFFSLISFEHPELFHILPCSWNRQLCTYWRDNGYQDVFDQYHNCDPPIHVYHGNCDTRIPEER